jgi:putative acetyltransferase
MFTLDAIRPDEYARLLEIWEASVKATHLFLKQEDIAFYKKMIQEHNIFGKVPITTARDGDNRILGFSGVTGDTMEMLFIDPAYIGKGVGKRLLLHAINHLKIAKVEVNEQNENALNFYQHFGFRIASRSELDGTGKPYPILHLELDKNFG